MSRTNAHLPIAFAVEKNGKPLCTAGLNGKPGVISVIAFCGDRRRGGPQLDTDLPETERTETELSVSGFDSNTNDHLEWHHQDLKPGDRIVIEVVAGGKPSRPRRRENVWNAIDIDQQIKNIRISAKSFGYRLVKIAKPER